MWDVNIEFNKPPPGYMVADENWADFLLSVDCAALRQWLSDRVHVRIIIILSCNIFQVVKRKKSFGFLFVISPFTVI